MEQKAKVIAVAGKGGVGKTSISAAIVRLLTEAYPEAKILAIDADPAVGLSTALGVEVEETLDDIRKCVNNDVGEKLRDTPEILAEARFRLFDAMKEQNGFAFIAIGRPEAAGCYCAINTYLRQVISMLADDFDYVVIDGEAGIEQVNRRVMEKVTHLLLITDQSRKGAKVIDTIHAVADELVMYEKLGIIMNRVTRPDLIGATDLNGLELLAAVPTDDEHVANDIQGKNIFDLKRDSKILNGTYEALIKMNIVRGEEKE